MIPFKTSYIIDSDHFAQRVRIRALLAFLLCWQSSIYSVAATASKAHPNILVIVADQWRFDAFGFAGNSDVKTPHLDQLQRESIWLRNALSSVPVCCPTRASMMTGQRALTHGVFMNDVPLSPNAVTLAKVLKKNGYDTGYVGKWHMDGHGRSAFIPRERRQGFDYWKVLECTHNYNESYYYADGPEKLKWDGYDAFAQTDDACQYLKDHATNSHPFLLFLCWGSPHEPYQTAPASYRALYTPAKITLRPNVPAASSEKAKTDLAGYYAHCTALDDCIGKIERTLRDVALDRNTLVIFTSDHGDMIYSQGSQKKQQPFDESIRIPFLLRWPSGLGVKGRVFNAPFASEDFMPMLLGLCNIRTEAKFDGMDFSGYLHGGRQPGDGTALIACPAPFGQWSRANGGREYRGVRTERYTYARDLNGPWILFDNREDPYQLRNLVGTPEARDLQKQMESTLQRKLKQAHDDFLPAAEYIRRWGYKVDATGTVPYTP